MARLVALLILLLAALAPGAARAHAALVQADPANGQVLASAPATVHLTFNEPVSPLVVRLFDPRGRVHRNLAVTAHDQTVMVVLPKDLGTGSHVLSYRVVSTDGHPVAGSIAFAVGQAGALPGSAPEDADTALRGALWLSRLILSCGLFVGIGGAFFLAWFAPSGPGGGIPRLLRAVLAAGLLAAPLALALQGLDALGEPLSSVAAWPVWRAGFETTFGLTAIVAAIALAGALASLAGPRPSRRDLSLAALVGVGVALALSGHAGSAEPRWLTRTAVFVHGIAVAYWIGGLVPLALLLGRRHGDMGKVVRAWSAGAVAAVTALVLTGAGLALVQIPTPAALVETAYGRILCVKLVLVVLLLALAAMNRYRLTPALEATGGRAERRLMASVGAELALALAVFGLVGLWRFTPPPRATITPAESAPAVAHIHAPQAMAVVTLAPGRTGPARARITISGLSDPKEVTLVLSHKGAGIEPMERAAARVGPVEWEVENLALPVPGSWRVELDILVTDFEKAHMEGSIEVAR